MDIHSCAAKKDEDKDGTITIKYTNDSMGTIEKFKVKYAYLEDQLKELKAAELEYDDAGEYAAEGFNKVLYTTILIDGKHYAVAMPKQPTEENFANTSMCYVVGFGCGAKVISQAWDEGNYDVHNSRIRVNNMDFDIMYERDTEHLCDSAVLAI